MSKVVLRSLVKSFGEVTVINNINIEVNDGEFVSFLGPSGCGKTTTLRMIAGFDMPTKGDIYIGERLVSSVREKVFLPPEERNIGMVFQNYAVWPHMDVFANVAYPLKIKRVNKRETRERVMHALSLVQLEKLEKRYPHQLSGGQQQRVALARALVMEPDVMLLDEPLSNLDAKLREEMRFEIKELQQKLGITIIYVTHDQAEAMAMSDRIMLLHNGVIQQIGPPREMYERPVNKFVADFIGLINFIRAEIVDSQSTNTVIRFAGTEGSKKFTVSRSLDPGKGVVFAVRPENILFNIPEDSQIIGKICNKVYLGNKTDYRVLLGDTEIRVETPAAGNFEIGQKVGLTFKDYVVFQD